MEVGKLKDLISYQVTNDDKILNLEQEDFH